jgi:hypothetical protein
MTEFMIVAPIAFLAGFAACWFGKDRVQALVIGANALSAKFHAKADALIGKK